MTQNSRIWQWSSAVFALLVGLVIVLNGSSAGYILVIIGFSLLAASASGSSTRAAVHPVASRYGLLAAALLLISLLVLAALLLAR